jgi:hypothetical protein
MHDTSDLNAPIITIYSPAENQIFQSKDTISLNGIVKDEALHELSIVVFDLKNNLLLFSAAPVVHDLTEYQFNQLFKVSNVTDSISAQLTVKAEDHGLNKQSKVVNFKVYK